MYKRTGSASQQPCILLQNARLVHYQSRKIVMVAEKSFSWSSSTQQSCLSTSMQLLSLLQFWAKFELTQPSMHSPYLKVSLRNRTVKLPRISNGAKSLPPFAFGNLSAAFLHNCTHLQNSDVLVSKIMCTHHFCTISDCVDVLFQLPIQMMLLKHNCYLSCNSCACSSCPSQLSFIAGCHSSSCQLTTREIQFYECLTYIPSHLSL